MILQSLRLTPYLSVVWTEDRQITNDCYHHPRHFLVFLNQLPRILQVGKKHFWQHLKSLLANKGGGAYLKMRSKSCSVNLWSASTGSGFILSEPRWQSDLFFSTKGGSEYARRAGSWGGQRLSPFCFYLWTDALWHLWGKQSLVAFMAAMEEALLLPLLLFGGRETIEVLGGDKTGGHSV